jgi:transcriptional regulator with XRE-family HTH domain
VWIGPQDHKAVGSYLQALRRQHGVSQDELAARLEKPQSFVSSYERGQRRVDLLELIHILRALGDDPSEIVPALISELVKKVGPKRA